MTLRAGRLDRRIILQDYTSDNGSPYGEEFKTWTNTATVWAQFIPVKGTEEFLSVERYAEAEARFVIRYRTGVTPKTRISFDSKTWNVIAVVEVGRQEALELYAKAEA